MRRVPYTTHGVTYRYEMAADIRGDGTTLVPLNPADPALDAAAALRAAQTPPVANPYAGPPKVRQRRAQTPRRPFWPRFLRWASTGTWT